MQDYIWDGKMDYGWEGLSAKVKSESKQFAEVMLDIAEHFCNIGRKKITQDGRRIIFRGALY